MGSVVSGPEINSERVIDLGNGAFKRDVVVGTFAQAASRNLYALAGVGRIETTDRGAFEATLTAQPAGEEGVTWFTDAAGKIWKKPIGRSPAYIEDYGIVLHHVFDATTGVPTGTVLDQAPKLQILANKLWSWGGGVIRARGQAGALVLGATVVLPLGVTLDLPTANKRPVVSGVKLWDQAFRVIPKADGSFYKSDGVLTSVAIDGHCRDGYLFFGNMDPAVSTTDYQFAGGIPDLGVGGIKNIRVDGTTTSGISVFRAAGAYECELIIGDMIATAVSKVPSLYTDKFKVKRVSCYTRPDNTRPLVDVRGTGDGLEVDVIESGYWDSGSGLVPAVGVWASNCRGGAIGKLINGIHTATGGSGVTWANLHVEGGQIIFDHTQSVLRDSHFHNGGGLLTPVVIRNTSSANGVSGSFSYSGLRFAHYINKGGEGHTGWSTTEKLDILLDTGAGRMDVIDDGTSSRIVGVSGQLDLTAVLAPRIGTVIATVETPLADLLSYGPMLQRKTMWLNNSTVDVTGVLLGGGSWVGISVSLATLTGGAVTFNGATGTYYYKSQLIMDPVRLIGRGATGAPAAVSIAAVNGSNQVPRIEWDYGTMKREGGFLVRLYRSATADDAFTHYVDVPAISLRYGYDDGNCFASIPWKTRASGAMASVSAGYTGTLVYDDGVVHVKNATGSSVPTIGTWKAGDKTFLDAPTVDANNMVLEGSTCIVAGTPGTWVARRFSTVSPAA
jgi:hypothetical protein